MRSGTLPCFNALADTRRCLPLYFIVRRTYDAVNQKMAVGRRLESAKHHPTAILFFLRGCAETGDQREPESHAGRRVRPGAEAARSGAWGGPNQRFGMSKRIFRNIAGPISPYFCMAKRYSTIQKICRRGGRGFRTSKRNFPALIFSFAPLTRFRQESGAPTLSVDAPLGGLNSILS